MMMRSEMIGLASGRDSVTSQAMLTAAIDDGVNLGVGMVVAVMVVVLTVTVAMGMVGSDGDGYRVSCSNDFNDGGAGVDGGGNSDRV